MDDSARASSPRCRARACGGMTVAAADDFAYHDPVDGSDSEHQGIRVLFEGGSRIVYPPVRHRHVGRDAARLYRALRAALAGTIWTRRRAAADRASRSLAEIEKRTGREAPTVIT